MQGLQAQLEKMKAAQENEQKDLQAIIETLQEDLQNLQGENSRYRSEMQRLQQENIALKSQQRQQQVEEFLFFRYEMMLFHNYCLQNQYYVNHYFGLNFDR